MPEHHPLREPLARVIAATICGCGATPDEHPQFVEAQAHDVADAILTFPPIATALAAGTDSEDAESREHFAAELERDGNAPTDSGVELERMPEGVQKLVNEARRRALALYGEAADLNEEHPQDTDQWDDAERLEALAVALEAAQRPPVSPEAREAGIDAATVAVEGLLASIEKGSDHGPRDIAEAALDAARFSVPSQPVYDEEKIARWIQNVRDAEYGIGAGREPSGTSRRDAAALVAALRSGELTVDGTSSDSERSEA